VAQRDYLPKLNEVPIEVDEDEETVKIVQLVKSQEPLVSLHFLYINCFIIMKVSMKVCCVNELDTMLVVLPSIKHILNY